MIPKLQEMNWKGFGLWSQHEAIKDNTIFNEVNYQRKADGNIYFDCEDHACKYRAVKTPVIKYPECVICFGTNDNVSKVLGCMHFCCCSGCFQKITECPVCRKPIKQS